MRLSLSTTYAVCREISCSLCCSILLPLFLAAVHAGHCIACNRKPIASADRHTCGGSVWSLGTSTQTAGTGSQHACIILGKPCSNAASARLLGCCWTACWHLELTHAAQ